MLSTDEPAAPQAPRRSRRWLRWLAIGVSSVLVIAAGIAYWALDRFVLDDVQISDVAAFEAQAREAASSNSSSTVATSLVSAPAPVNPVVVDTSAPEVSLGPVEPEITKSSYRSAAMSIEIEQVVNGSGADQLVYFVADVRLTDPTTLRGGFANNEFGENIIENTSDIAKRNGAVFAINGDYYGFRNTGIVIRNGVLFRDEPARTGMALYTDGRAEIYDETTTSGDELIAAGVWNTFSFGPPLVDDGVAVPGIDQIEIDTNFGNHSIQGSHPRTGLGVIEPGHFVFVAVDGRSPGYSRGMTLPELADLFVSLGATEAYNLDGGGSTTMWFNDRLINNPRGKGQERGTSDALYLAEAATTE